MPDHARRLHPTSRIARRGLLALGCALVAAAGQAVLDDGAAPVAPAAAAMATPPPFGPNLDPGESLRVRTLPPVVPSGFPQPKHVGFHEFQADCEVNAVRADDPIVFPRRPGMSHSHTFVGARTTARSTTGSLSAAPTSCSVPGDHSSYWFPTMYLGDRVIRPRGPQIIYYKSGVEDAASVRAFPRGLRFVLGDPKATQAQFRRDSRVSGWTCGTTGAHYDFPARCERGSQLLVRYKAPSCWDGRRLDSPDHKSHMAYPVDGACPAGHPVALPMLEYKIAYPVDGDLSRLRLASGHGYSWHADFFAAWDMPTQEALVTQCINGGGQCDARGFDQHRAGRGRVLDAQGRLIRRAGG